MNNFSPHAGIQPVQVQAVHRWFWRSVVLALLAGLGMIICSMQQYLDYRRLRSDYTRLRSASEQLHACLEQKRSLKDKLQHMRRCSARNERARLRPVTPYRLLQLIDDATDQIMPEEVSVNKRRVNFVVQAPSVQDVLAAVDRLRTQNSVSDISIISLEQTSQGLKASLRAQLTKPD